MTNNFPERCKEYEKKIKDKSKTVKIKDEKTGEYFEVGNLEVDYLKKEYGGYLRGSLKAFEDEILGLGFTRWVKSTANENRIRMNAEKHFEELQINIKFAKEKIKELE